MWSDPILCFHVLDVLDFFWRMHHDLQLDLPEHFYLVDLFFTEN